MRRRWTVAAACLMMIGASACGGAQAADDTLPPLRSIAEYPAMPAAEGPDQTVEWNDYSGDAKAAIDAMVAARDCVGLEHQLAIAKNDSPLALNRVGHTNAKLIGYIRDQLNAVDCSVR